MFRRVLCCLCAVLLLSGCGHTTPAQPSGQNRYEVTLTGETLSVTGIAENGCFTVTAPETLAGTVYQLTEDGVCVSSEGITLPAPEKAWSAILLRFLAAGLPQSKELCGVRCTFSPDQTGGGVLSFAGCEAAITPLS